jgi:hypothetical protein
VIPVREPGPAQAPELEQRAAVLEQRAAVLEQRAAVLALAAAQLLEPVWELELVRVPVDARTTAIAITAARLPTISRRYSR